MSSESQASRLKELVTRDRVVVVPGAFDPLSARLAEQAGFEAIQCTGLGLSAVHLGLPDYSFIGMNEMVACTERIVRAVSVPVAADADTGFGNAVNVFYAVRAFEAVGAAGLNLEDQVMPKRCGHLSGKELVDFDEAVVKIRAASDARRDPDFVINARTDALAVEGMEGVIRRGNAYLDVGATMVFVEGVTSLEEIAEAVKGIDGPVAINVVEGGKSPEGLRFSELQDLGVARISVPGVLLASALHGMQTALRRVIDDDGTWNLGDLSMPFRSIHELIGTGEIEGLEERYLRGLATGGT